MELIRHGHACFSVLDARGRTWLFDPYRPGGLGGKISLLLPQVDPFAVLCTHAHEDHAWRDPAWEGAEFVEEPARWPGARLEVVASPHDDSGGAVMGFTKSLRLDLEAEGGVEISVAHAGDIGSVDPEVVELCRGSDVLLVPAGGHFTIGPEHAEALARAAEGRCAVLMHLREPGVDLEDLLEPEAAFARISAPVRRIESGRLPLPGALPATGTAFVWMRQTCELVPPP